jgi:hypothetical protein
MSGSTLTPSNLPAGPDSGSDRGRIVPDTDEED